MTRQTVKIMAIEGSPRRRANSTTLMEQVLAGARAAGAETSVVTPWNLEISPCTACYACNKEGRCTIQDDYQDVYDQILASDAIVLATPVYFGAVSAQVKPLIDRCESFWGMTRHQGVPLPFPPSGMPRKGVLIVSAGQDKEIMFTGPRVTFDFMMRTLQGEIFTELLYGGLNEPAGILENTAAMQRAFETGRDLTLSFHDKG